MDAITRAEGFDYSRQHLMDAGSIENHGDETTFAFHSHDRWADVRDRLRKVWGYGDSWSGPTLLTLTPMKDGRVNYVFKIDRI